MYHSSDKFFIIVMDAEENLIHKEDFGWVFPAQQDVAKIIEQAAIHASQDPLTCTGKIDKRTVLIKDI